MLNERIVYGFKKKKKRKQVIWIQHISRRICETTWHKEISLKEFEECPICKSKAYHRGIVDRVIREGREIED